ncbi:type II CRISPR-associated endonuclease Cas1 [Novipirellula sp.]|uniref:type II CRISPR-associated endonuclease Cas1 n=1 Tax=Novipirellula sp. TaxID=2795430 RepID=UPI003565D8C4
MQRVASKPGCQMIKQTLEISQQAAHLCIKHRQLQLKRDGSVLGTTPCEDVGVVVVDHPQTTYSHQALVSLAESGAAVVLCGRNHLPTAMLLPLAQHGEVVWRIADQISASAPLKKRLWQQLVVAKIKAQATNLKASTPAYRRLMMLASQVRSGDPSNLEAQAAKIYWQHWLDNPHVDIMKNNRFRRDQDGDGINACLNYGYAVLRAALGRAIVAAGLQPSLGVYHQNRGNHFCLADDLIEPFRPLVDDRVRSLNVKLDSLEELTQPIKAELLGLLTQPMKLRGQTGPLMVMMHRLATSLVRCYSGEEKRLEIPVAIPGKPDSGRKKCESTDTE